MTTFTLEDKKIIVTGAGAGIGKAIVEKCLNEGATVIACDINQESLDNLNRKSKFPTNLYTYTMDVSHYDEVQKFFEYIQNEHPDSNSLINNAGIYLAKNILDYEISEIDRVLNINIKGFVYFSQQFAKILFRNKTYGSIVNMSSVSGMEGSSDAIYGLSKAAILGLTKSCAMNFAPYIKVNAVAPTMVDTSMMAVIPDWRKKEYLHHELINTPVLPEDVADTVVFLLSEKSTHYTGATFDLNNGGYLR
ncbi:SDR family NAD(P)-dependent oxidoreductase [Rummeliibacillus pycnus]|uniref:SDR family NAD(P)-dependent oxidoreductase n=1 Tax=Rummeliibacillus pycnus TaxID=101070 RepID=UPI000C9A16AD|nr:SDR family oxidoreductase [Rummeliibacillus pycnus]